MKLHYDFELDEDMELVSGSFSATSTEEPRAIVRNGADLFFYALAIVEYDGSDTETTETWMRDTVKNMEVGDVESTTVGGVKFEISSFSERSYYLDISKAG